MTLSSTFLIVFIRQIGRYDDGSPGWLLDIGGKTNFCLWKTPSYAGPKNADKPV